MEHEKCAAVVRKLYDAYASMDISTIDGLVDEDIVMHVAGRHALSGDKRGKPAMWDYFGKVAEVGGGQGGFEIHAITADGGEHAVALMTGTIRDFHRHIVHIWHVRDGHLVEFWDAYPDQAAEDEFWITALPSAT